MDEIEIIDLINETTTDFNNEFKPELYPDVRIGDFMTITNKGSRKTSEKAYGEISGTQDLDGGSIDENTTTLETEDVKIKAKKAPYYDWGKSVIYTKLGVERSAALGIELDTTKLEHLRGVAFRSMQKTALCGHAKRKDITGLLNNRSVEIEDITKGKPLDQMSGGEVRKWFINLFKLGFQQSGSIIMPNTIAIDSMDLLTLSGMYDKEITNGNGSINVLQAVKTALEEFAEQPIHFAGIPQNFAAQAGKNKSARAVVYTNTEDVIYQDWALAPTADAVFQRSPVSYEVAIQAQYTGAIITQLDRILYIDYKSK